MSCGLGGLICIEHGFGASNVRKYSKYAPHEELLKEKPVKYKSESLRANRKFMNMEGCLWFVRRFS
jgi:hypothetical protein